MINLQHEARRRFLEVASQADSDWLKDGKTFALVLQTAVGTCGVSQGDLARLFGINHSMVSRWVNGRTAPSTLARWQAVDRLIEEVRRLNWLHERLNKLEEV